MSEPHFSAPVQSTSSSDLNTKWWLIVRGPRPISTTPGPILVSYSMPTFSLTKRQWGQYFRDSESQLAHFALFSAMRLQGSAAAVAVGGRRLLGSAGAMGSLPSEHGEFRVLSDTDNEVGLAGNTHAFTLHSTLMDQAIPGNRHPSEADAQNLLRALFELRPRVELENSLMLSSYQDPLQNGNLEGLLITYCINNLLLLEGPKAFHDFVEYYHGMSLPPKNESSTTQELRQTSGRRGFKACCKWMIDTFPIEINKQPILVLIHTLLATARTYALLIRQRGAPEDEHFKILTTVSDLGYLAGIAAGVVLHDNAAKTKLLASMTAAIAGGLSGAAIGAGAGLVFGCIVAQTAAAFLVGASVDVLVIDQLIDLSSNDKGVLKKFATLRSEQITRDDMPDLFLEEVRTTEPTFIQSLPSLFSNGVHTGLTEGMTQQ